MHTETEHLATPEALDDMAAEHGATITGRTFRAMAASWRAVQRELNATQSENSKLAAENARLSRTIYAAALQASQLEAAAVGTANILARGGFVRAHSSESAT